MHNPRQCFNSQLRNEEEEEDLETTKKKKKKHKKTNNYHISTQMSQNSKKQDSKYESTKNLVFMFEFQTRKMQNKRRTELANNLPSCMRVAEKFVVSGGGGCCKSELRLACLVLLSSISMSSVHENCVHFSHSATCSVSSHNTSSSHSFCEALSVACPQNRCWADTQMLSPNQCWAVLFKKKNHRFRFSFFKIKRMFLGCEFELSFFFLKKKRKRNLWFWFSFFKIFLDVVRVQV
jgi:hypothetical protein